MSDEQTNVEDDLQMPSELDMLKQRARVMGITFSNNIGLESLKARIQEKLDGETKQEEEADGGDEGTSSADASSGGDSEPAAVEPVKRKLTAAEQKIALRKKIRDENLKLIRLRITNLDPKKKDLPGEIFTVANEYLGTVRKFVPFGEHTDNGYHVPYCIYKMMKNRKFLQIKTTKRNGKEVTTSEYVREFALEVLPQLTRVEIDKLAASQAAAGGLE